MSRTMTLRLDDDLWKQLVQKAGKNRSQFARDALEEKLARTRQRRFKCLDYAGSVRLPTNASTSREWLKSQMAKRNQLYAPKDR
jgi:hypothetical protein